MLYCDRQPHLLDRVLAYLEDSHVEKRNICQSEEGVLSKPCTRPSQNVFNGSKAQLSVRHDTHIGCEQHRGVHARATALHPDRFAPQLGRLSTKDQYERTWSVGE